MKRQRSEGGRPNPDGLLDEGREKVGQPTDTDSAATLCQMLRQMLGCCGEPGR